MRKIVIILTAVFMLPLAINSQTTDDNTNFNKWQARFRVIAVIPDAGDDISGANVDISTAYVPELDFTYFITENWAAELILATTKHDVDVNIGNGIDLGHVWLLPPTLNIQYHFTGSDIKPYLGAGINYTFFYGVDEGDVVDMEYENSFGFSTQAGIDYSLSDKWFLNLDVKKLFLKTDVDVNTGDGILPVEVEINPLIVGLGVGLKF